jgi:hypothetical protein
MLLMSQENMVWLTHGVRNSHGESKISKEEVMLKIQNSKEEVASCFFFMSFFKEGREYIYHLKFTSRNTGGEPNHTCCPSPRVHAYLARQ